MYDWYSCYSVTRVGQSKSAWDWCPRASCWCRRYIKVGLESLVCMFFRVVRVLATVIVLVSVKPRQKQFLNAKDTSTSVGEGETLIDTCGYKYDNVHSRWRHCKPRENEMKTDGDSDVDWSIKLVSASNRLRPDTTTYLRYDVLTLYVTKWRNVYQWQEQHCVWYRNGAFLYIAICSPQDCSGRFSL